ncbi:MAG: fused MFS/spermidine synthase [Pseudomonadota bacterium]|jgi:spermidine synthase|nr:MAG: transferase [Pseudomonadota bacterium]
MGLNWRQWLPRWLGGRHSAGAYVTAGPAGTVDLRFAHGVAQSRMRRTAPDLLVVDYTRTMLAALLWRPAPRRVGIIGLGGGSQAKFLYRHFPQLQIEALEISPEVLELRGRFHVPPDDERFTVRLADAAEFLPQHPGRYDLMLVDAYDAQGIPPALGTPAFQKACHDALAEGGVLATNLYCDDHAAHFGRLREAFGGRALLVEELRQSNRVAFAWRGDVKPVDADEVLDAMPAEAAAQLRRGFLRVQSAYRQALARRSGA